VGSEDWKNSETVVWGQERRREEECFSNREHKTPAGHSGRSSREEEIPVECAGSGSEFFTAFANEAYLASSIKPASETALQRGRTMCSTQ